MKKTVLFFALLSLTLQAYAEIKFATYNIRHFDSKQNSTNKAELRKILDDLDADFITVQEIVNTASFKSFFQRFYPQFKMSFSRCGGRGKQQIGFVYNSRKFKLKRVYEDARVSDPGTQQGQYGCGRLRPALIGYFENIKTRKEVVVIGVHLKAGGRNSSYQMRTRQYDMLTDIVGELNRKGSRDIIIMGDFNTTGYVLNDVDYHNFEDMLSDVKMKSVSERIKCTSYWSGENRSDNIEESSILDHIVYPSQLMGMRMKSFELHSHCARARCENTSAKSLGISYKEVTDHCPVSITFE